MTYSKINWDICGPICISTEGEAENQCYCDFTGEKNRLIVHVYVHGKGPGISIRSYGQLYMMKLGTGDEEKDMLQSQSAICLPIGFRNPFEVIPLNPESEIAPFQKVCIRTQDSENQDVKCITELINGSVSIIPDDYVTINDIFMSVHVYFGKFEIPIPEICKIPEIRMEIEI